MGMLSAVMLIALLVMFCTYYLSQHRITEHIYHNYSGTFHLIGEGVARHKGANRAQWLSAIERLSDLHFEQHYFDEQRLTERQVGRLLNDKFLYQVNSNLSSSQVYILLPEEQAYLSVELNDYGTSLIRISAFLMLNELGRHKGEDRLTALTKLRAMFDYPIQLKKLAELTISTTHIRTVKKGDIAVVLNVSGTSTPTVMAYAPLGNSPYTLVLGSIPFFDWFPLSLIIAIVLIILVLMAAASFYLVRPLEHRLENVDAQIEQIAKDKDITVTPQRGFDAISKLSNTVKHMATRIHKLINAQNDMVRAISHELRAPITRVRFQLAVLEQGVNEDEVVNGVERNLEELETLIDEVLTFSKLKREQPELQLEQLTVDSFINDIVIHHQQAADKLEVSLYLPISTDITVDAKYMNRALSNLLLNAYKYAKKRVKVGFEIRNSEYLLWVEDDGPGIPEVNRHEVLSAFTRVDESRDRRTGGYGLGLAIVEQIARWHQGNVNIEQGTWGGAKVSIAWPKDIEQSSVLAS